MDPSDLPDPKSGKLPINARIALARLRKACTDEGLMDAAWAVDRVEGKAEQNINHRVGETPSLTPAEAIEIAEQLKLEQQKGPGEF